MKFIVDECTGPTIAQWLKQNGYDVISIFDEFRGCSDEKIIEKAFTQNRIIITNDKDFGEMIFRQRKPHRGVILLRLGNERSFNKIYVLENVLKKHALEIADNFVVATETAVRIIQHTIDA